MTRTVRPGLHGWGYEGRSIEDLIRYVNQVGASTVVDVRLNPISRRKGFSKRKLGEALEAAGVNYLHLRELGNPRENREAFAQPGTSAAAAAYETYRTLVLEQPEAVEALGQVEALIDTGVVLLCFEADGATCHRRLVLQQLTGERALQPA